MLKTRETIEREYRDTSRMIARLYSTYTALTTIRCLYRDLEIARENELRALETKQEGRP